MAVPALIEALSQAADAAAPELGLQDEPLPTPELIKPRVKEHGDWSTNLALVLAARAKRPPREVADAIVRHLAHPELVSKVEVAGPGFINLFLLHSWLHDVLRTVINRGADLYNKGEWSGCYRLYEGSLLTVKPLLKHRPALQKAINEMTSDEPRATGYQNTHIQVMSFSIPTATARLFPKRPSGRCLYVTMIN